MKDPTLVEDFEKPKSNERVKINGGGTVLETTISTLTRLDDTVLSAMVKDRWRNEEELFVDRDPTCFGKVLNYLRDGENFALPTDRDARECLRREAEFYNLPELAKMCGPGLRVGDCVQWKESAIEEWWKFMARCECYGVKRCPVSVRYKNRKDCGSGVCGCDGSETLGPKAKAINYDDWVFLKHKMKSMKGYIKSNTCCDVEKRHGLYCGVNWDNGWSTHNHESELLWQYRNRIFTQSHTLQALNYLICLLSDFGYLAYTHFADRLYA